MTRHTIDQHHQPAGACASPQAVVFVFDDLHDWQTLAAAALAGAEVVVLDGWSDGLAQMATHLQGRSGIAALHVLSHGTPGSLLLGSLQLTAALVAEPAHAQALATIGQALAEEGDILVYGCRAGAGELGAGFVQALALATGAHVAAAKDLVGAAHLGGSWALDRQQGAVGTAPLTDLAHYQGVLAVPPDQTFTAPGNVKVGTGKSFDYNGLRYSMTGSASDASYEHYTTSDAVLTPRPAGGSYLALDYIAGAGVSQVTVSAIDGSPFRLMGMSFMVSESAATNATSVQYTLTPQNGAPITTYMSDVQYPQVDFSSNPDFYNITSFTFSASAPGYPDIFVSLDDIVFSTPLSVSNTPTLTATGGTPTFTEGSSPVDLFSAVTAATNDAGQTFSGMTLTVGSLSNGSAEILTIGGTDVILTNGNSGTLVGIGSYSVSVAAGTATVSVTGMTRSDAQMGTLIDGISYRNASQDPGGANRVVTITNITDSGGSNNTAAPGLASTVSITPVNDAPTASATGSTPTYTEDGAAVTLFSGAAISTVESGQTITAMRFTVTNVADGASEQLVLDGTAISLTHGNSGTTTTNSLTYAVSVAAGTATVTLTKAAGVSSATAQTLLSGATYQNTSDTPTTGASRVVTLTSIDDNGGTANGGIHTTSLAIAATVTVVAVNDAPTLSGGPYAWTTTNEDTTSSAVTVSTLLGSLTHGDVDSGAVAGIAITGSTGNGTWQYSTDGTTWATAGTVSNTSALLLTPTTQLRFVPDGLNGGAATLTFRAWDQTSGTASTNGVRSTADTTTAGGTTAYSAGTAQATLTVSSLNDAPVTVNDSIAVAENSTATVLANGATSVLANDTDADLPANALTAVLVTGPSHGTLTLNANGTFSYVHNGSEPLADSFTYRTSDGMAVGNVATVNITVTNVNDAPTVATPIPNQSATTGIAFPFTFAASTFADTDAGDTLTYSAQLVGGGALPTWLSFDPATRSFSGTPGAGDAGAMSVRVTATDTGALSAHSDFTLTVISAPFVSNIVRTGAAAEHTSAATLGFTVTFSEAVQGVDAADFTLTGSASGGTVGTPATADGGLTWTVAVTGAGEGSLRLDLKTSGTGITSTASSVAISGGYTTGQGYAIDRTLPLQPTLTLDAASDTGALPSDRITSDTTLTLNGTAEIGSTVTLYGTDGTTALGSVTAPAGTWTFTTSALPAGAHTLTAKATDLAGNTSSASLPLQVTIDTSAPAFGSATVNGTQLVLTYTDAGEFDTTSIPAAGAFTVIVGSTATSVVNVAANAAARTITLTLGTAVQSGATVTVAHTGTIKDMAGNASAALGTTTVTNNTSAPSDPVVPPATTVDGVPVTTTPGPGGSTIITIPVVVPTRPDTPGTGTPLADIPLVISPGGSPIVSVSVPTGVGLSAEGLTTTTTGSAALAELGFRIERIAGDNPELTNAGQVFYATLAPNEPLSVQILKPTIGAGYDGSQPLVINGSANPADGKQAVIVDARSLPSGTVIQVDNIEFIAVVGNVRLIGGAGQNAASGDGSAQWIVLGPDDDTIHGGGGNDTVGSEAGDDQVYGDAGDDIVFGGAGNDLLSGGTGSDRLNGGTGFDVAIQEGARTDYTVVLEGAGIKLTHTASGVSDWLVDVEQVRFATGPSLTVAHSAAEEAAAFLFQKWLGRDLNQGEGAIIQSLAGQSAEQVATLFAQVFPTQTAGKTPAQLLEGMAAAGAIRVDAIREVTVTGDAGHNTISPTLGLARYVDGGAGTDTVVIPASLAQTHVQHNANGSFTLQRMTDGAMVDVTNVERVSFSDTKLALDLNGNAGQAAKLLGALAGPGILANKGIVGEVIRLLDAGATSQTIAGLGLQLLGANTPTQVAQTLWTNVTGRAGTDGELKILTDIMAGGTSAAELVVMAANLDMNATRIDLVGLSAKGIEFA